MSAITPTFSGEMQLAGWSESHTGGCKVTFWLQSPDDLAAFRTLTTRKGNTAGHRFMAALVEIGDDELPVSYPPGAVIPADKNMQPKIGPLAYWAVLRCKEAEFQNWISASTEEEAKNVILSVCEIDSRKLLDTDYTAGSRFREQILGPYSKHLIARGIVA